MENKYILLLLGIFLLSFASAYQSNEAFDVTVVCLNDGYCSASAYCNINIEAPNGTLIIQGSNMTNQISFHNYTLTAVADGTYQVSGYCDDEGTSKAIDFSFYVTESGYEMTDASSSISAVLLFILCFFLILSIIGIFVVENYIGKFSLYWISHLFSIIVFYVSWQYAVEGVILGTGILGIFKLLFYISIVAVFPMVILSMAWIFYIHTFNEHFQNLVDKGMDSEEAFAIAQKKTGGWFSGR